MERRKSAQEGWEQQHCAGFPPEFLLWRETKNISGAKPLPHGLVLLQPRGCRAARMLFPPACGKHKLSFLFPISRCCCFPQGPPSRALWQPGRQSLLSRPSTCFSHLTQLVRASFRTFFFVVFQLLSLLVATPVLSSCYLLRHSCAGSIPICWQQRPAFPSFVCLDIHPPGAGAVKAPLNHGKDENSAQGWMRIIFAQAQERESQDLACIL